MLKIFHINTFDIEGGAARAAYRINKGLCDIGVDSKMLVQTKDSDDKSVIGPQSKRDKFFSMTRPHIDQMPFLFYRRRKKTPQNLQWLPCGQQNKIRKIDADIYHLHWICNGFVRIEELARLKKPIVWTLHDMWPFTGGCHISGECKRYIDYCGKCPQLGSICGFDISRWVWSRKDRAWRGQSLTIVAPSRWMAECARESRLFCKRRIEVIHNGLDIDKFKPIPKEQAREIFSLPQDKKIILFGAINADRDQNKGLSYIVQALRSDRCSKSNKDTELVIFGVSSSEEMLDLGIPVKYVGRLYDDVSLAVLYSAADVMVVSSIQESFGQTASEAMACACPVVAFRTSGLMDIVDHEQNGYLAEPFSVKDLANGIYWVTEDSKRQENLAEKAREKAVREFDLRAISKQYLSLYEDIKAV